MNGILREYVSVDEKAPVVGRVTRSESNHCQCRNRHRSKEVVLGDQLSGRLGLESQVQADQGLFAEIEQMVVDEQTGCYRSGQYWTLLFSFHYDDVVLSAQNGDWMTLLLSCQLFMSWSSLKKNDLTVTALSQEQDPIYFKSSSIAQYRILPLLLD